MHAVKVVMNNVHKLKHLVYKYECTVCQ